MAKAQRQVTENCLPKDGVPGNPLPLWKQLPLSWKLPVPQKVPKGKAMFCTTKLGSPVTRMFRVYQLLTETEHSTVLL